MNKVAVSVFFSLYILFLSAPAHAYLDPGNGSMLLQLLLGGVAGLSVVLKLYWRRFLTAIGFAKQEATPPSEPPQSETPQTSA